ncbi:NAD(P)-binding protein [Caenimonas koreensis DSM 17982]|uniref:NAD(P)-binding protein n=1 Tax=Caenimonas koreensis DSM 17982 TaxID=1121255 RepID=A0A844ARE3_9BURK|nr:FAD-dependent oxidoreductase [Caenimonas koreensis]MRD46930.1 NAD(P)-binding protein [Caenimonas koreensis DSM 17982]
MRRREWLAGACALPLAGCAGSDSEVTGTLLGASAERGHLLRDPRAAQAPSATRRVRVVIAGGGIAGLAAARALRLRGIDDFVILELEDTAGGNSRAGSIGGIACPLGAHYLPVPGDAARDVQDFLEETGVRQRVAGRWVYDERHLCHSPQERLFFRGHWQEGLLPVQGVGASTLAQYVRFARLVDGVRKQAAFSIPAPSVAPAAHLALDSITMAAFLSREGLDDPHLRWYLDYSCRDDYGAGTGAVSAWAGLHYFASRHGFQPPGADNGERESVLTWPQGNAWLTQRLAAPLGERVKAARVVSRIEEGRSGVEVDGWNALTQQTERWQAEHCIVAMPVFIAARVVRNAPAALAQRASQLHYAPWIVANMHVREPLRDRPGAPPSWDNVVYAAKGLGYVDARHQSLDPRPAATVLSWYCAPGEASRAQVLSRGWRDWLGDAQAELAPAHPDLMSKLTRVEVARYGHAMAIPVPGTLASLQATARGQSATKRLSFAHADWAGYSIFEEAFTAGHRAGLRVA